MKKFIISSHAGERMALREINLKMIKEAILISDYRDFGKFGRLLAFKVFPKGLMKVVYVKEKENHFIISVIWERMN